MKKEVMKRLLEMSHECSVKGWAATVEANALLIASRDLDDVAMAAAVKFAREARGHFAGAVSLLDEVAGKKVPLKDESL